MLYICAHMLGECPGRTSTVARINTKVSISNGSTPACHRMIFKHFTQRKCKTMLSINPCAPCASVVAMFSRYMYLNKVTICSIAK